MSLTYVPSSSNTASLNLMASNFISTGYNTVFSQTNMPAGYRSTDNTLANILAASSSSIFNQFSKSYFIIY